MQAVSTASKIKHSDIYYQDINYNFIFIILTTNIATNKVSSGHSANNTHNVCITGVFKVCKSTPN